MSQINFVTKCRYADCYYDECCPAVTHLIILWVGAVSLPVLAAKLLGLPKLLMHVGDG